MSKNKLGAARRPNYPHAAPPNPARRRLPGGRQGPIFAGGRLGYTKEYKREQAIERRNVTDAMTVHERLAELEKRPGESKRERDRLIRML